MLDEYKELLGANLKEYIIAQENHKDEGIHFHVYLRLKTPIKSRNVRFFDLNGYHPNV